MKIESSNVQVKAQSFSELSSTSQTSFDFKQTLLGFVSKEGETPIQNSSVQEIQKKLMKK